VNARPHVNVYFTSIVVTLSAGSVTFSEVPLAVIVPAFTGCTGFWPDADVAVI